MNEFKQLIRLALYGWKLDYHLNQQHKFNHPEQVTVLKYHYGMAQYYYEKIYGKPFHSSITKG